MTKYENLLTMVEWAKKHMHEDTSILHAFDISKKLTSLNKKYSMYVTWGCNGCFDSEYCHKKGVKCNECNYFSENNHLDEEMEKIIDKAQRIVAEHFNDCHVEVSGMGFKVCGADGDRYFEL